MVSTAAGGAAMGAIITFIINNYNKNKPKPMPMPMR